MEKGKSFFYAFFQKLKFGKGRPGILDQERKLLLRVLLNHFV